MIRRQPRPGNNVRHVVTYMAEGDRGLYQYVKEAILREEFMSVVWEDIVEFYKNPLAVKAADPKAVPWPKITPKDVEAQLASIQKVKREVICFNSEVRNWVMSYKMRNFVATEQSERLAAIWQIL